MKKFLFFLLGLSLGMAVIWGIAVFMQDNEGTEVVIPEEKTENISVSKLTSSQEISSPLLVEGQAKGTWFFEGTFPAKIVDEKGTEIGSGSMKAIGDWMTEDFVEFKGQISFDKTPSKTGFLILEKDNPSGLKENAEEFKMPVVFKTEPAEIVQTAEAAQASQTVKVFFSNLKKDPEMLDCEKVYAVERKIDATKSVATRALEELLKGPTSAEKANGYFTAINDGVKINKISIIKGVAYVDFTETLQQGVGGSCKTLNIISQIKETLKQFSSVKEVKISIEGESEAILQP
ncbi:GerMN domain-containing protein [Candidatus Gracilibacteria bacterium]|nr:GerMN domain-containing protein [Candidatus Gracilibacteria bacterium]